MADTVVTPTALVKDAMSADLPVTGMTAIVAANNHKIAMPREGRLLIVLNNTFAGAKVFTVNSGNERFVAQGVGDLALSLAQDDVRYLMVSSDRFLNSDGDIDITVAASTTGFIGAFYIA